jgi:transcriptional regulator with XRE-family HTH domain
LRLPSSLLNDGERRAFARWLQSVIEDSGKAKTEFARAVGDESTERLNRYLKGGRLPTKEALRKIARAGGVPYVFACLHAGYFEELLPVITALALMAGKTSDQRWLLAAFLVIFACFPSPPRLSISGFAKAAFIIQSIFDALAKADEVSDGKRNDRPLLGEFAAVKQVLRDSRLPPRTRREIAALVLTAWARRVDPRMAAAVQADYASPSSGGSYLQALQEASQPLGASKSER